MAVETWNEADKVSGVANQAWCTAYEASSVTNEASNTTFEARDTTFETPITIREAWNMRKKTSGGPIKINKFHDGVWTCLVEIGNPRLSAAFALRVALAALPMLAQGKADRAEQGEFLWYWPEEDREKHLLAVCRALQVGWSWATDLAMTSDADAAFDANTTTKASADAAFVADTDTTTTFAARAAAFAADATSAANAAAAAARADNDLMDWIRRELARLSRTSNARAYLADGAAFPLLSLQGAFLSRLRGLPTFDYWADWFQDRYDGKPMDLEILKKSISLPEEIAAQGPRAINRYLADLAVGGKEEKIRRVRAIFIGNGEAGKTSLIAALNGRAVAPDSEKMTRGIEISQWPVPGTDLTAHFWDFGGQVIAHATHQFFLRARCVYVLVLNARSADSNPNQQAGYWLEFVRAFGNDAPVLLVGNKCDLTPVSVDLNRLQESYPNIRGFHGVSSTEYAGEFSHQFAIFRDAFVAELTRAGEDARLYFSRNEFAFIEALRRESGRNAFLEKATFDRRCREHGIDEGEKRQDFLTLLDQLGEVIHFPALYRAGFRDIRAGQAWQHGVCLASRRWQGTGALIRADYQSRVLALAITGPHAAQYFSVLYDSILEILDRMPKLKVTKRLHLIEAARIGGGREYPGEEATEDFDTLLTLKAEGQGALVCKFGKYDLEIVAARAGRNDAGGGRAAGNGAGGG
uniref:GTPase SAR1 family protein n=1 Tax=Candidatus Kentrum sp. SD TaxID=2126332 RepID=A0A451BML1_9GAMM|nr:MAG: GTPase SAR1 family protein [Candidatus Kentron sp. SD]VFK45385.1 MAG: GTPase SAR1 family protein [Candidatus Kentron sp. SD]VFK79539.1 MAG: GTPase SAR1 family protein [Candidatus Kentron sp. SD]